MIREKLFLLGPFCPGFIHHGLLKEFIVEQRPGWVRGAVYRGPVGFPIFGFQGEDQVEGSWLVLEAPEVLYRTLDELHGCSALLGGTLGAEKRLQDVALGEGQVATAWAYGYTDQARLRAWPYIRGGQWRESLSEQPDLTQLLDERQKQYLTRLALSTGREVVPIEMEMYRQLIRMELIVDRGRRLALTQLGREVVRHLKA